MQVRRIATIDGCICRYREQVKMRHPLQWTEGKTFPQPRTSAGPVRSVIPCGGQGNLKGKYKLLTEKLPELGRGNRKCLPFRGIFGRHCFGGTKRVMKVYLLACSGYSERQGADLLLAQVDEEGRCSVLGGCRQGGNPSFCTRHGDFLYVLSEVAGGASISACRIVGEKILKTGREIQVPGCELCHLYAGERALYGSCYGSGDFFAVDYELKELLWHRTSQTVLEGMDITPHAHWSAEWDGQLFLADLGSDRIWRYRLQEGLPEEELPALVLPAGAGPRQLLPTGDSRYLLSVQEPGSTLCMWKWRGEHLECAQSVRTTGFSGENYPGTICMADERTVLVCNRGANTLSAFSIDSEGLKMLGEWETANWPRYLMRIPDTSLFVNACNKAGKLVTFMWTGRSLEKRDEIALPGASCAAFWGLR